MNSLQHTTLRIQSPGQLAQFSKYSVSAFRKLAKYIKEIKGLYFCVAIGSNPARTTTETRFSQSVRDLGAKARGSAGFGRLRVDGRQRYQSEIDPNGRKSLRAILPSTRQASGATRASCSCQMIGRSNWRVSVSMVRLVG